MNHFFITTAMTLSLIASGFQPLIAQDPTPDATQKTKPSPPDTLPEIADHPAIRLLHSQGDYHFSGMLEILSRESLETLKTAFQEDPSFPRFFPKSAAALEGKDTSLDEGNILYIDSYNILYIDSYQSKHGDAQQITGKYLIQSDGTLRLPVLGRVNVGHDDHVGLSSRINKELRKHGLTPNCKVFAVPGSTVPEDRVVVVRDNARAQHVRFAKGMVLLDAIAGSGGIPGFFRGTVTITRPGESPVSLNVRTFEFQDKGSKFLLKAGDIISFSDR